MSKAKFKVGDRVVVTGDTGDTEHLIDAGSHAVIMDTGGPGSDAWADEYLVSVRHTPDEAREFADDDDIEPYEIYLECETEWVHEDDLNRLYDIGGSGSVTFPFTLDYMSPAFATELGISSTGMFTPADPVNHPTHYTDFSNGAEVIDIAENLNFNRGNAVKYLARAGAKDAAKELEDLKKARFYVEREIKRLEAVDDE